MVGLTLLTQNGKETMGMLLAWHLGVVVPVKLLGTIAKLVETPTLLALCTSAMRGIWS